MAKATFIVMGALIILLILSSSLVLLSSMALDHAEKRLAEQLYRIHILTFPRAYKVDSLILFGDYDSLHIFEGQIRCRNYNKRKRH